MAYNILQSLPSVELLVNHDKSAKLVKKYGHETVVKGVRVVLDEIRAAYKRKETDDFPEKEQVEDWIVSKLEQFVRNRYETTLLKAINATGVVLHTGLGRAVLNEAAQKSIVEVAQYCTLATDRLTGRRGHRDDHLNSLICELTGAEAATVVNNNSAATMLILNTLAKDKEVILSRGQLVEIGGAFRMPDVMETSGCTLREVGTTNKTHVRDYENAICEETAAIMRVHHSNYRIMGFSSEPEIDELAELAHKHNLPVIDDIGSGALVELSNYGVESEPLIKDSIACGSDVICFSGDKLVGGPQAGIIVGSAEVIKRIKKNPLSRAFRIGKLTIAALEATLKVFLNPERLETDHPVYRMFSAKKPQLTRRAGKMLREIKAKSQTDIEVKVVDGNSQIGSGSVPVETLPSKLLSIRSVEPSVHEIAKLPSIEQPSHFPEGTQRSGSFGFSDDPSERGQNRSRGDDQDSKRQRRSEKQMTNDTEKKHIIIGTSGHIDHGKTSLVKALTGVDADTLIEEKKRGITIELGFVFMKTPVKNEEVLFIDVPGHEKLVKTMVAGAANLDSVLFVVAADEGINMQTVEHFDILKLLDIPNGIIAISKSDLVDEHQLAKVTDQMTGFVEGSFLEGAPIIPVSSITGDGLQDVKDALYKVCARTKKRSDTEVFRMPVDRVFTMQGFGTVVAGTILSGSTKLGDEVEVFPDRIRTKIRGVQVHREKSDSSTIGKRTAINLLNVEKDKLRRGQCIATPGTLLPSERMDGKFHVLSNSKPVKNMTRLRFYTGTSETICRVFLLDRDKLEPGETAAVQFVFNGITVAQPGDRFVIRSLSPLTTVGGGTILDVNPVKHKRFDKEVLEGLTRLEGGIERQTEQIVYQSGLLAVDIDTVFLSVGKLRKDVEAVLENLVKDKTIFFHQDEKRTRRYLHSKFYGQLKEKFITIARQHLAKHPDQLESPFNELRSEMLAAIDAPTFKFILAHLIEDKKIERRGTNVILCDYQVPVTSQEKEIGNKIEQIYIDAGIQSPIESKVCEELGLDPLQFKKIMASLINRKIMVRLSPKVSYHQKTFEQIVEKVLSFVEKNTSISVAQYRDELKLSRKYAQAILEYCDEAGITKRDGDLHVLP